MRWKALDALGSTCTFSSLERHRRSLWSGVPCVSKIALPATTNPYQNRWSLFSLYTRTSLRSLPSGLIMTFTWELLSPEKSLPLAVPLAGLFPPLRLVLTENTSVQNHLVSFAGMLFYNVHKRLDQARNVYQRPRPPDDGCGHRKLVGVKARFCFAGGLRPDLDGPQKVQVPSITRKKDLKISSK
jgi:hypothetical protein